ncbi:MAG TPA: hypothetical protein VN132_09080 [Bdellovibrio sp.]|nr:hypothetical protein [Bdellovibrio sp.]
MVFLYLGTATNSKKATGNNSARSEKFEKSVNKHLMITNENMEMQRQRTEIENARFGKEFGATQAQPIYTTPTEGTDLNRENTATEIANELGRGERKEDPILNPNDVVQKEIFNKQQAEEYSQAYKREYARQFIENARRGGYKVILSEDFRVLSVTPIRHPSQNESIMNSNSGSSGFQ